MATDLQCPRLDSGTNLNSNCSCRGWVGRWVLAEAEAEADVGIVADVEAEAATEATTEAVTVKLEPSARAF